MLNAMAGDSTESPQETVVPSPNTQDSDKLLKQTVTDLNIDTVKGPAHNGMLISAGDTLKRHLQDTNLTDCLVKKEVVQNDFVGDSVPTSTTLRRDSPGQCDYGANTEQSTTLKKDSPGLYDYSANAINDYITNTVQNTTLQKGSPGLCDYSTNTVQSTTLRKDLPLSQDCSASFGESITFQKNPSRDMVVGGDSLKETLKSDVSVFKIDSSFADSNADTENKVSSTTEGYYGRSVSVQMCSSLASQSSLRGSIIHSSSTGHLPTSDVQLRREFREQLVSDVANVSDNARSTNNPTAKEHTLPNPWRSQESSKGPHLTSLDKNRSYEDDTRWVAALWSGVQTCGSCGHKQGCYCQNKNSQKQCSGHPEQPHPAPRLPVSHS